MKYATIAWLRDDGGAAIADATSRLAPEEINELAGFSHPQRQRGFVLSRLLLRQLLAPRLQLPSTAIRFQRTASGRLILEGNHAWQFSLSHATGLLAVIVADAPCGVDIERPRAVAMERIARRYFATSEQRLLSTLEGEAKELAFFRLWTLKEAGVKALGEGLAHNLARLAFDISGSPPLLQDDGIALRLFQHADDFHLAAALATAETVQWEMQQIDVDTLLRC